MKVNKDVISSLIFAFLSLIVWFLIPYQIQLGEHSERIVNAQLVPKIASATIFILSIVLFIQSVLKLRKNEAKDKKVPIPIKEEIKVVIVLISLFIYALIMPIIGFILSSILICSIILLIMNVKKWKYYVVESIS